MVNDISQAELKAAIEAEKQRIKIEPYYTVAMNKAFKGNTMGLWSGTTLGMMTGAVGGLALSALAAPFSIPAALVGLPMVLGLAGLGGVMGSTVGSRAGSSAGAVSGGLAELERRLRADKLEADILQSPDLQRQVVERFRVDPVTESDNTIGEIYATHKDPVKATFKIIRPLTMLLTLACCAAAGAVMFSGAFAFAGTLGFGAQAAWMAKDIVGAAVIGSGIGSIMGVAFGIYYPGILTSFTRAVGDLLSGKIVQRGLGMQPEPELPSLESVTPPRVSQHNHDFQRQHPHQHVQDVAHHERLIEPALAVQR